MTPQAPPANTGRDGARRFAPGNPGGPGNPHARRVAHLRRLLLGSLSDQEAVEIMKQLIELARGGNLQAIKLVLQYTVGKPAAAPDPDFDEQQPPAPAPAASPAAAGLPRRAEPAGPPPDAPRVQVHPQPWTLTPPPEPRTVGAGERSKRG
jgi:hypothetical protein